MRYVSAAATHLRGPRCDRPDDPLKISVPSSVAMDRHMRRNVELEALDVAEQGKSGRLPSCDSSTTITLWHFDAGSGRRPPHQTELPSFLGATAELASIADVDGASRPSTVGGRHPATGALQKPAATAGDRGACNGPRPDSRSAAWVPIYLICSCRCEHHLGAEPARRRLPFAFRCLDGRKVGGGRLVQERCRPPEIGRFIDLTRLPSARILTRRSFRRLSTFFGFSCGGA
jgi:hypothetical protein